MLLYSTRPRPRVRRYWVIGIGVLAVTIIAAAALGAAHQTSQAPASLPAGATAASLSSASIAFFERRLSERPGSFTTADALIDRYMLRFRQLGRRRDLLRAAELAEETSQTVYWEGGPLVRLASIRLAQHDFPAAERAARAAAALDQRGGGPVLFDALMERGAYEEAMETLATLATGSVARMFRIARLEEARGNLAGAELAMARACKTLAGAGVDGATLAWCRTELGDIALASGRERLARRRYREALAAYPDSRGASERLAWLAYQRGELDRARTLYREVFPAHGHADVHLILAKIFDRLGDSARAAAHVRRFEAAAHEADGRALYRRPLALLYAERPGYQTQAIELAWEDLRQRPTVESYDVLAWAYFGAGRIDEAREAAEAALSWGRPAALALYHAGLIAVEAGAPDDARRLLQEAIARRHELDPDDVRRARDALAIVQLRQSPGTGAHTSPPSILHPPPRPPS